MNGREMALIGFTPGAAAMRQTYGLFFSLFESEPLFAASSAAGIPNADNTEDCILDQSAMFWRARSAIGAIGVSSALAICACSVCCLSLIHISEPTRLGMISY